MLSFRRVGADLSIAVRGYVRSRDGLFFSLVFPVILILIFGAIFSGTSGPIDVYVQNNDGSSAVSTNFVSALNATNAMKVTLVASSVNFSQYLLSHSASEGIVIPQGFSAQYESGRPVNVTVYQNPASSSSGVVLGITSGVVDAFNLQRAGGTQVIGLNQLTVKSPSYKTIDFLIPGLIGFTVLTNPMFALVSLSSEYKRDKIFKQLSLTPLTKTEWLLSRIAWYTFMSGISFVLMTMTGVLVFGAQVEVTLAVLPFVVIGPFLFVSLGMLVGTASKSVESAGVVGNVITFPMMFLSGTFFPLSVMPAYLQALAHIFPLFYVIDGLNEVMIYGNYSAALYDFAVLVVISAVIFALAVRFFKWRED